MPDRSYEGDAIDASMKPGPWVNEGETVAVADESPPSKASPDLIKSAVDEILSEGALPYTDARIDLLEYLDRYYPDGKTTPTIADELDKSNLAVRQLIIHLPNGLIISEGRPGCPKTRMLACPVDTIRREIANRTEYNLPTDVDPLKMTSNQREIIGLVAAHPSLSCNQLAERVGVHFATAANTLDKFGYGRTKQQQDQSPPNKIELEHAPDTAERAWQLKKERGESWPELLETLLDNHDSGADLR